MTAAMLLSSQAARQAGAAAALLRQMGAADGRPLALLTESAAALCVLIHAGAALGLPLFPLDPTLPDAAIADLLAQSGSTCLVGDRALPGCRYLPASDFLDLAAAPPPPSAYRPDSLALLVATSGSSGRPKAVMLSAGNLAAAAAASAARTPLRAADRWLACLPLFHIGGYSIVSRCAYAGAEAVIHPGFAAARVLQALADERITHLSLVPAMLAQLLALSAAPPPPSLRHVLIGGAALSGELAERAADQGWPIQPTYGMSETASQIATLAVLPRPWRQGQVGLPLPGATAALGADGRLRLAGPMVMTGYANPALTPGDGLEDGWFVTSDLAEIDARGELTILGRTDDVIVTAGKKVLPAQVEDALAHCPGVTAVGVVGRADAVWGEVVTAIYSGTLAPPALLDWCRANIA